LLIKHKKKEIDDELNFIRLGVTKDTGSGVIIFE